jgi:ABC-type phosphate transport system substrate-binding protein
LKFSIYLVITFVARLDGSGGGFSRMISGGGVFGGVGRSLKEKNEKEESK